MGLVGMEGQAGEDDLVCPVYIPRKEICHERFYLAPSAESWPFADAGQ